jgi:hypothetical protein
MSERYWQTIDGSSQSRGEQHRRVAELVNAASGVEDAVRGRNPNVFINELVAEMVDEAGGLATCDFEEGVSIAEMIDTSQGQMALLQKVRVDVAFGLAEIPLLYGPIYDRIAPPGGFPGGMFQIDEFTLQGDVIFLEKFEGGEVQFGTLRKGQPSLGKVQTYAAGFEWTEDMIEFDLTYNIEINNRAFGRAYNALLNHLHLSPIIGYTYTGPNQTAASSEGDTLQEHTHWTFRDAYTSSVTASPRRTGTLLLASEADRFQIEDALLTPVRDAQGNPLPNIPINTIIYYDGEEVVRGTDVFTYPGVTPGVCYLVFPKRRFKEMIQHDLRIDDGPPDISRLVEGQQVGRARRGLFADIPNSVEEVTLPSS